MKKLKALLGTTFAAVYFIFPMGLVFILLIFTPLMFQSDVSAITTSGFAGPDSSLSLIGLCGLCIGISLLIPALRKMYDIFPWLFSFVKIFFMTFVILNLGIAILNFGYQIDNPTRHTTFYILMIVLIIVGRLAMCFYLFRKPVNIGSKESQHER